MTDLHRSTAERLLLGLFLFGIVLSTAVTASAAEFGVRVSKGDYNRDFYNFSMTGPIEPGDAEKLSRLIDDNVSEPTGIFRSNRLTLESPGGSLDPAIALANLVRNYGIATYVDAGKECLSGCAIVFMAGSWKDGDDAKDANRRMHHTARLGFHAPFAFAETDSIDPEVARLLLKDAERGGSIAASRLVRLSLDGVLPASLVEELLQYEANVFLYVDTVDRAGRWGVQLENAGAMQLAAGIVEKDDHEKLSRHCDNLVHWGIDVAHEGRDGSYGLTDHSLVFDGMDHNCRYKPYGNEVGYEVDGKSGTVLSWQTLVPDTRLDTLTASQLTGATVKQNPYSNPPLQQVDGPCKDGFQWVGGWSGASYRESVAYALYRSCDTPEVPIKLECEHGSGRVDTRIALPSFGSNGAGNLFIKNQIDDKYELSSMGFVTSDRGMPEFVSSLQRDYFIFQDMMAGSRLTVKVNDVSRSLHLTGSSKAISAMMEACL